MTTKIGLIADTHGLLRPEAVDYLSGCDAILHAGDIGNPAILDDLQTIAPTEAIRGNIDTAPWARALPDRKMVAMSDRRLYLIHRLEDLDADPGREGIHGIVYGHSHHPGCRREKGVLYINPGSAGPRRFRLPVSIGRIVVTTTGIDGEITLLIP